MERLLVAEGHRPQAHQPAARAAHVLNVFLVAPGRRDGAELSVVIDHDRDGIVEPGGDALDARDESVGLGTRGSDADGVAVAGGALVADVDVIATGDVERGFVPDGDVIAPGVVGVQRLGTDGRVEALGIEV